VTDASNALYRARRYLFDRSDEDDEEDDDEEDDEEDDDLEEDEDGLE
jgi:hypothetical protein